VYAVIFASGKHSRLLLAYGNSKPPVEIKEILKSMEVAAGGE